MIGHPPPVPGLVNLRDLGGRRGLDGRMVRRGIVLRSELPLFLGEGGIEAFRIGLGVDLVLDLRMVEEAHDAPSALATAGVDVRLMSVAAPEQAMTVVDVHNAASVYVGFLDQRPDVLADAVGAIVSHTTGGVLVHCAAGKDRTGVVSALVLELLGVGRDAIVADYLLTGPVIPAIYEALGQHPYYAAVLARRGGTPPSMFSAVGIRAVLERLESRYGGARELLLEHGTHVTAIDDFMDRALEPG